MNESMIPQNHIAQLLLVILVVLFPAHVNKHCVIVQCRAFWGERERTQPQPVLLRVADLSLRRLPCAVNVRINKSTVESTI